MKRATILFLSFLGMLTAALILSSCSELKSNLPGPVASMGVAHEAGWNDPASANFHGRYVMAHQWDLSGCTTCHAQTYQGGTSGVNCSSAGCHVDAGGLAKSPEACNTCHGTFNAPANDTLSFAPPRSAKGDTATTAVGVGAHAEHLVVGDLGRTVDCQSCHVIPARLTSPGHITPTQRATVTFQDLLGRLPTQGGLVPNPSYDATSSRCSNSYCHGNFRLTRSLAPSKYQYAFADTVIAGANATPLWTGGEGEASCGSCHGLPPAGHILIPDPLTRCGNSGCHPGIVDAGGKIIDPTKHINGKIDVEGVELSY